MDIAPYEAGAVQLGYVAGVPQRIADIPIPRPTPEPNAPDMQARMAVLESAPAHRPSASEYADGGAPGACGIPYLDAAGKDEQAFVAAEGECAEYVAEIEAEGY